MCLAISARNNQHIAPRNRNARIIQHVAHANGECLLKNSGIDLRFLQAFEEQKRKEKVVYNSDRADVAQLVEQLIRNQ